MPKAFLSHSSNDKDVVKRVFDDLGAAGTHYDEATFEAGERTASEIYSALLDTDLFVLFVSPASIDSPWVQTEIALAQQKLFSRHIKQVIVFLLRDVSPARLPEWLRDHVYQKLSSPSLIAKVIRSKLLEMAVETGTESQIFLGRDKTLASLKAALARISTDSPDVIFLAGTDGIGRRSLAKKALQETYPGLPKFPIEIVLSGYQGEVDFYKELLASTEAHTIAELLDLVRAFPNAVPIDRATLISDLLGSITKQKQVVFLRGHESVVKDDGNLHDWIDMLVRQLPKRARPQLVVIARRMIPAPKRSSYTNVYFGSVQSLSRDYSKDVLSLWLKELEADFPSELMEDIINYVVGHPKNIEIAARYAAEVGLPV